MYLELAMLLHSSSELQANHSSPSVSVEDPEADPEASTRSVSPKKSLLRLKAREKAAASVAIRLATAAGIAQKERIKLFGKEIHKVFK